MKKDINEAVDFRFTDKIITQLSAIVDETEPGIARALTKAVPLVLNELTAHIGHGFTPDDLLALVREADATEVLRPLADPARPTWHEPDTNLLLDLLGDRYRSTVNQIAVEAGIRPKASGTLLQMAATAVVGVLGKCAAELDLSPTDFVYWLHAQQQAIGAAMLPLPGPAPAESHLVRQAGATTQLPTAPVAAGWADPDAGPPPTADGPVALRWQWGAMLLVAVCLGYFFGHDAFSPASRRAAQPYPTAEVSPEPASPAPLPAGTLPAGTLPAGTLPPEPLAYEPAAATAPELARPLPEAKEGLAPLAAFRTRRTRPAVATGPNAAGPNAAGPNAAGPNATGRYDQDRDTYIYDTGKPIVLKLADGTTQKVGANSTENRLYTFLATPSVQVDSVNRTKGWINFDRINFETGQDLLTPESALQLGNIASILATFPRAVVKLGGYTDSTGDALGNLRLSEGRARAAMLTLVGMGVSSDRVQAKGYGSKYFVRPNNTPSGRALNRRISIRVISK